MAAKYGYPQEIYGPELILSSKEAQRLHEVAYDHYYAGEFPKAIDALDQALKLTARTVGSNHCDMAILLATLADGNSAVGNADKVFELQSRCVAILKSGAHTNSILVARIQHLMAKTELERGNLTNAVTLVNRAAEVLKLIGASER